MALAHGQHCPACKGFRAGIVRRYRDHQAKFTRTVFACGACETESPLVPGLVCRRCGCGRLRVYKVKLLLGCIVRWKKCKECKFRDRTVERFRVSA